MSAIDTVRGVRAVVDALRLAHPMSNILLHSILPRADAKCIACQATIDKTNAELKAFASAAGPVEHVDCGGVFPRGTGPEAKVLMPDHLHPSAEGYRQWFKCLHQTLARTLQDAEAEVNEDTM